MISVVIPTLNEKKNIFVDDNSSDGTFKEIEKFSEKKKIKGFKRKKDRDLTKSVIYGVLKTKCENILVMDCDLQHDVSYIFKMWKKYKKSKYEIVIGSRFGKNSFFGNLGFLRSIISKTAILLINIVFGKKAVVYLQLIPNYFRVQCL